MQPSYDYSKLLGKMKEKGYTQIQLAKQIGVSEATLNFSLCNKRFFKQDEIVGICDALGIEIADVDVYFFSHKTIENYS